MGLIVVVCVFLLAVLVGEGLASAGLWATVLGLPVGMVGTAAALLGLGGKPSKALRPSELTVPGWVVDRPAEVAEAVAALLRRQDGPMGSTTSLYGAGGFGKTILAKMVCADPRMRQRFKGGVQLVTIGRDVRSPAAIAAKVNDVIEVVGGERSGLTDPQLAGRQLGALLDTGLWRLLVLDDVWEPGQLAPFIDGGRRCARLVTTRIPELLAGQGTAVRVDQMSAAQARSLLTDGLPPLNAQLTDQLLALTGRWPLLLRLANKILANAAKAGADLPVAAAQLLQRLQAGGPAAVDDLLGGSGRSMDAGQPEDRALAVRETIGASTDLLDPQEAVRFAELSVFAVNESVPFSLVARLWQATAGVDELRAAQVCARLDELALISADGSATGGIKLHDVIRDFLRAELEAAHLAELNGMLLDAVAAALPSPEPSDTGSPARAGVRWWALGPGDRYVRDHLIEHQLGAGRAQEAAGVASDLRWVGARLLASGPAAPAADLALAGTPETGRLQAVLERTAHLLTPAEPAGALIDVLHSRVAEDPQWGPQVAALRDLCPRPRLVNRWPLPDLPDSALRRVLTGHEGPVTALAIAPDGSWLVTGGFDYTARIWDAVTGEQRAVLADEMSVITVAVAPDGSWLATGGVEGAVRIWDVASGQQRAVLTGHESWVNAVAVAPGGGWLATASSDGTARVWDAVTGQERAALAGHQDWVHGVAVAPDGSWLATSSKDGTARIWDAVTGHEHAVLAGHDGTVYAVAIAPDGSWLATGAEDGTVRTWDAVTGHQRGVLAGHEGTVYAVAIAPDGSWLASGGDDRTARIWDASTGHERAVLTGHDGYLDAVAIAPDGCWLVSASFDGTARTWDAVSRDQDATVTPRKEWTGEIAAAPGGGWLVTAGRDGTARVWDAATGDERAVLTGHESYVTAVAVVPEGGWLATGGTDNTVRIWDAVTAQQRAMLTGHESSVEAIAVAPDGSWLATGSRDGTARIWDLATGRQRAVLDGHKGTVYTVAVAPGGGWLATGGEDGTTRIWDVVTWQEHAVLTGHEDWVNSVAVAPDGSWLATGSRDGTARIWDVVTRRQRAVLTGHKSSVQAVAVAPDGRWLATSSFDFTTQIWDVTTWQARALMRVESSVLACSWLGSAGLAAAGPEGLYLFDFLTGSTQPR